MPGHYYLDTFVKDMNFSKKVPLYFNFNKVTTIVLLDALIYKTSDIIQFCIMAVDSRTRPIKMSKKNKISILDFNNNVLKSWENVIFIVGTFKSNFEYRDLIEGFYEILVEVDETVSIKI